MQITKSQADKLTQAIENNTKAIENFASLLYSTGETCDTCDEAQKCQSSNQSSVTVDHTDDGFFSFEIALAEMRAGKNLRCSSRDNDIFVCLEDNNFVFYIEDDRGFVQVEEYIETDEIIKGKREIYNEA